ncbi:MAG: hypothetical protein Q9170_003223 [Blastenia crenularia]
MISSSSSAYITLSKRHEPQPPVQRSTVVGGSSEFLTKLAAQERRILELREELEKAERDLSRLKKQWAQHEAVKKRNEFRQQEQLLYLRKSIVFAGAAETVQDPDGVGALHDASDTLAAKLVDVDQGIGADGEETPCYLNGTRQTQRKIFSGSRHIRTLSLLSKISSSEASLSRVPYKPMSQGLYAKHQGSSTSQKTRKAIMQHPHSPAKLYDPAKGQPKEISIETGKQFVGELREGLWTFFEDLRQAAVGEEASSIRNHNNVASPAGPCDVRIRDSQVVEDQCVPKSTFQQSKSTHTPRTSSEKLFRLIPVEGQVAKKEVRHNMQQAQSTRNLDLLDLQVHDLDEEDAWDAWDTPVADESVMRDQTESVASDSLISLSTGRDSPRSSMR